MKIEVLRVKTISQLEEHLEASEYFSYFLFFISGEGIIKIDNYNLNLSSNVFINIILNSEVNIEINNGSIDAIIVKYHQEIKEILSIHSLRLFCPMTGALKIEMNNSVFSDMVFYINKIDKQINSKQNNDLIILNLLIIVKELSNEIGLDNTNRRINNKIVLSFINLLDANYQENKNIDFYSDQLFISNRSLYRAFKNNLGISPKEFINFKLTMEAKKMLLHTSLSIKEISVILGFHSQYNFSNFFKKNNNNIPPNKYKGMMSKNHILLS